MSDKIFKNGQIIVLMPISELFHFHVIVLSPHLFPRGHPAEVITLVTFLIKLWSESFQLSGPVLHFYVLYWDFHSKLIDPYLHTQPYIFPG